LINGPSAKQLPTFTLDEVKNMNKTALVNALNERFPGKPYKVKSKDSVNHLRTTLAQWRPTTGDAANANNNVDDAVNVDDNAGNNVGNAVNADNNSGKTWCVCEMPIEDYNEEEMTMVQCQGAACKQIWFHYNVLVNLRTGTLLISTITVLIAVEEITEYNNVYIK
jgi:hypothetical protein